MSQQINLLAREHKPVGSALWALTAIVALLLGLLAYDAMLRTDNNQLRLTADAGQRELAQVKAAMAARRQRPDADKDAAALKAEIDELKPRAEVARQLLEPINMGSLGSPDGYAQYLIKLGSVSEQGLWITSVSIGNAGKLMSLSGRALRNESVLRYAKRLNEAFAPYDVQFKSLEMTPENMVHTAQAGKPALTTVAFKLH